MDTQAQMQAIVDKVSGAGKAPVPLAAFDDPWRKIYFCVTRAGDFTEAEMMLYRAARDIEDGKWLARDLTNMLPHGDTFTAYPSLEEMSRNFADVRWLWPSWIPRGMVTLLGAAPGMGKSLVALDLARRIISGEPWPDGQAGLPQADYVGNRVLIVDAEGAPALLNQRAREWQLDGRQLFLLAAQEPAGPNEPRPSREQRERNELGEGELIDLATSGHQALLLEMCRTLRPALVVVDSLAAATTGGETSIEGARAILGFLATVAREHDLGLLVIHHLRKRATGARANYRPAADDLRGSSHLSAAARSVLVLSMATRTGSAGPGLTPPVPPVPTEIPVTGRSPSTAGVQGSAAEGSEALGPLAGESLGGAGPRRLEVVKTNLCRLPPSLEVVLEEGDGAVPRLRYSQVPPDAPPPLTQTELCARWLLQYLEAEGPQKPGDVVRVAADAGFARRTLYRARQAARAVVVDLGTGPRDPHKRWDLRSPDGDPGHGGL